MPLVASAIAPHGGIVVAELCAEDELAKAAATRAALEEIGRRFRRANPDTIVVVTPHNVHVDGRLAVVTARRIAGEVEEDNGRRVSLEVPGDRQSALAIVEALRGAGLPAAGVTFGGNDPDFSDGQVMPMDWGTLIPLWFLGGRFQPPPAAVVVSTSRDVGPEDHVAAGRALASVCAATEKRIALVASADHAHAHTQEGPYGYDPRSREYDELVVDAVRENRLGDLIFLDPALVEGAKADSWWQLLVRFGALEAGDALELLSYEAPTYFGMLCAVGIGALHAEHHSR